MVILKRDLIKQGKFMNNKNTKVTMIGLGYIGLPTAAVMADNGYEVIGYDVNPLIVQTVNRGEIHIVEPGLQELVGKVVSSGTLRASSTLEESDIFVIAVPTPFKEGYVPDLRFIEEVAKTLAPVLKKGDLVVLESTSPVGTTEKLAAWLATDNQQLVFPGDSEKMPDVNIAYCPERVLPGKMLEELVNNDRIIGGMTPQCSQRAIDFYSQFVNGECIASNSRTAEMCKLTENSFRDVNIAFANELSLICDKLNINVWDVIKLANHHPRVNILQPGPGVGGHCIAVDPWFIVNSAPEQAKLIKIAREVNDAKPNYVLDRILYEVKQVKSPNIALLGLSFKANVDDLRESPALEIALTLVKENVANILLVEPNIHDLPDVFVGFDNVEKVDLDVAISKADIIVGLVDHDIFRRLDKLAFSDKIVIDTRGMW